MSRAPVLLDTSALLALTNRNDALHSAAVLVERELAKRQAKLLTTDWVLAEFLGGAARLPLRAAAIELIRRLKHSARTQIIAATRESWKQAFDFYASRKGQGVVLR
jgi:predicted nucleic acid-binding protein